jgi:hypothetical protein
LDDVRSHDDELWLDDSGASGRDPYFFWAGRARDGKQLLLIVLAVVGVGVGVYLATRPTTSHYHPLKPAQRQLADRFASVLLARGNCTAAGALAFDGVLDPRFPHIKNCQRYLRSLGSFNWYLTAKTGTISRHCAVWGGLLDHHADDCVAYPLIAQAREPWKGGRVYYRQGWLVVYLLSRKHEWKIDGFDYGELGNYSGPCSADCSQLWNRRIRRSLQA